MPRTRDWRRTAALRVVLFGLIGMFGIWAAYHSLAPSSSSFHTPAGAVMAEYQQMGYNAPDGDTAGQEQRVCAAGDIAAGEQVLRADGATDAQALDLSGEIHQRLCGHDPSEWTQSD